jgi:hypothetical protein
MGFYWKVLNILSEKKKIRETIVHLLYPTEENILEKNNQF